MTTPSPAQAADRSSDSNAASWCRRCQLHSLEWWRPMYFEEKRFVHVLILRGTIWTNLMLKLTPVSTMAFRYDKIKTFFSILKTSKYSSDFPMLVWSEKKSSNWLLNDVKVFSCEEIHHCFFRIILFTELDPSSCSCHILLFYQTWFLLFSLVGNFWRWWCKSAHWVSQGLCNPGASTKLGDDNFHIFSKRCLRISSLFPLQNSTPRSKAICPHFWQRASCLLRKKDPLLIDGIDATLVVHDYLQEIVVREQYRLSLALL